MDTNGKVLITLYTVEELQKEGAKALEIDKGIVLNGPIELKEEDNYVMCKSCDLCGELSEYPSYLVVGEERFRLQPHALEDPPVKNLITVSCECLCSLIIVTYIA